MAGVAWRDVHIGPKNDRFRLDGVEVWREEWRWIDAKTIHLPDPLERGQTLSCMLCEVGHSRRPVRFAAGQMQGGLWAFYVSE